MEDFLQILRIFGFLDDGLLAKRVVRRRHVQGLGGFGFGFGVGVGVGWREIDLGVRFVMDGD